VAAGNAKGNEFDDAPVRDGRTALNFRYQPPEIGPRFSREGAKLAFSVYDNHVTIEKRDLKHPELQRVADDVPTRQQGQRPIFAGRIAICGVRIESLRKPLGGLGGRHQWQQSVQIRRRDPARLPPLVADCKKMPRRMLGGPAVTLAVYTVDLSIVYYTNCKPMSAAGETRQFCRTMESGLFFGRFEGVGRSRLYRALQGERCRHPLADSRTCAPYRIFRGKVL